VVHAVDDTGAIVWGPVTVPSSGFIEPASGSNASYGITDTTLFQADQALVDDLAGNPRVKHDIAVAKVFGRTLGGMSVESGEWQFPIDICFRCLISFPSEASSSTTNPNCDMAATTGTSLTAPCSPGQDDTLDCRICKEIFPTSPAVCNP
jgi:hypothetical protein